MPIRRSPIVLVALIACLEPVLAQETQPTSAPAPSPAPAPAGGQCLALADGAGVAAQALRSLQIAVGEKRWTLTQVRFVGLAAIGEERIWQLVGGRPGSPFTIEQAAALIARLAGSGVFARVEPTILGGGRGGEAPLIDGNATLEIRLAEHASVKSVVITGLDELTRDELLEDLFVVPDDEAIERGTKPKKERDRKGDGARLELRCPAPAPPREWLARYEDDRLIPGLVWRGLPDAVSRIQRRIEREGYLLGRVRATLDAAGKLTLAVDEGRVEAVVVEGVHPDIAARVGELLGLRAGAVYNSDDLEAGLDRVEDVFPFLRPDRRRHPAPPSLDVVEEHAPDGTVTITLRPGPPRCGGDDDDDDDDEAELEEALDDLDEDAPEVKRESTLRRVFRRVEVRVHGDRDDEDDDCQTHVWRRFEGRRLIVTLKAKRFDLDADPVELLRHTQATSYAPGLLATLHVWDPGDRVHFALDTLINVNTSRASREPRGSRSLEELAAAERVDFAIAPWITVPRAGLAELGGQVHAFVDSDDAWRVSRLDSYLNSILFDRPDREVFRRTGLGAFATFHLFDALTVGGEYRLDQYDSLNSLADADTFFGDNPGFPNPAIDSGVFGSLLFRLEWATTRTTLRDVHSVRRPALGTIVDYGSLWAPKSVLRTVTTFEVADPDLGGRFSFWRVACDNVLRLAIGDDQAVSLRLRVGGGEDLPIQKREALGGWGTLRGYELKELSGDWSLLGALEYRLSILSAFLDVGAVRDLLGDWQGPRAGLGVALNLGDDGQLAFAWRTDDAAEGTPEIRLLFGRPW